MRLESKTKEMPIRILPSLPVSFVIGSDFLEVFRMDIGFENRTWIFEEDLFTIYNFDLEDWKWLSRVLKKIKDADLSLNSAEFEFCYSQVKYLGFLVNENG